MKVLLDVEDNQADLFIEMVNDLEYVDVLKMIEGKEKNESVKTLKESFDDIALYKKGELQLRSAQDLLNDL
jgi:hypothetical protein